LVVPTVWANLEGNSVRFIAIDNYHGSGTKVIEADSVEEAAELATGIHTMRPLHIEKRAIATFHVVDDVSHEGWGPGCKYENHDHDQPKAHNTLAIDHFWLVCLDGDVNLRIAK